MKQIAMVRQIKRCEPYKNGMTVTALCFDGETREFFTVDRVMTGTSFEYGKDTLNIDPLGFGEAK